jgi:HEPN domain
MIDFFMAGTVVDTARQFNRRTARIIAVPRAEIQKRELQWKNGRKQHKTHKRHHESKTILPHSIGGVPAPDPKLIFKTADIFSETAATILHKAWGEEKTYLQFAVGVNAALATELYLKCLLLIECGQFPRVHDLKRLFSQLRRGTQQRLRKMHDQANR